MYTDLEPLKARLAECTDVELNALVQVTYRSTQWESMLLAWLDMTCRWEVDRRRGYECALRGPGVAADDALAMDALIGIRYLVSQKPRRARLLALLDAVEQLVVGRRSAATLMPDTQNTLKNAIAARGYLPGRDSPGAHGGSLA